ncbi:MAG TPA: lysozyme [Rhodothermales bacterium]|nr:lysozyme [Rhodothermales bacterium]
MMKMSDKGRQLLADWEGLELKMYKDVAGLPTIGVGHLLTRSELTSGKIMINGEAVRYANGITKEQALDLLGQDLQRFEDAVNESVTVTLSQNQFDTLVSFSFNVGVGAFKSSTLLKELNKGKYDEVPTQLKRWVKSGGRVVQGLVNRRNREIDLWNGTATTSTEATSADAESTGRTMSEKGRELLATWEGLSLVVYKDVAGLPTIGVGHLLTQSERASGTITIKGKVVDYADGITKEQALDLLGQDLVGTEKTVNDAIKVPLSQNQFDTLVSFTFNVGSGAFQHSTLLKKLNLGMYDEVPNQLRRWVFAGGQRVRGLEVRRENEIKLWSGDEG